MTTRPSVFIGSSSEGLRVAETIQVLLEGDADVTVWKQGVFGPSRTYIESLEGALDAADFAVLVLTPDDFTVSRGKESDAPRDNVLFELGLFAGRLGRERCYFVQDETAAIKVPTDLLGVSAVTWRPQASGNLDAALGPAATRIRRRIAELGPRLKLAADAIQSSAAFRRFREAVQGDWWERVRPDSSSALSLVRIEPDPSSGSVRLRGRAYGREGRQAAVWASVAACIQLDERKVFYYWKGWHPDRPAEPFEGIAEICFEGGKERFDRGYGAFSDSNLTDLAQTTRKSFELRRATEAEVDAMDGAAGQVAELVREKIASFG